MVNVIKQPATNDNRNDHRYQPFAGSARPPQHPQTHNKVKKSFTDSRDDAAITGRYLSKREHDENDGYTSDGSVNSLSGRPYRDNDPVTVVTVTLKQALKLQKVNLGLEHPSVTRAIHSLAIEYKVQGKLNKAVPLLKEGIDVLDSRITRVINQQENEHEDDDSRCSMDTRVSVLNASEAEKTEIIHLLEEKSTLYSCLGNIFRMKRLYREAVDCYMKSCEMLVEAGYSGESKRVAMMVRIIRRTENERIAKPPVRQNVPVIQKVNLAEFM